MPSIAEFNRYFSIPHEPGTALAPGQFFAHPVPNSKKVIITDIYAENLGGGNASLEVMEQRLPASFSLRYVYTVKPNQTLSVNLSTGLCLGDQAPIKGNIRVRNSDSSGASLLLRVNGRLVG